MTSKGALYLDPEYILVWGTCELLEAAQSLPGNRPLALLQQLAEFELETFLVSASFEN